MSRKAIAIAMFLAAALFVAWIPSSEAAQVSCQVTRAQIESALAAGATGDDLQNLYGTCTAAMETLPAGLWAPSRNGVLVIQGEANVITNTGSIFWERIESCGYHPQREEAECAIEIRQNTGFGGQICQSNGSTEYVLFCVNYGGGGGFVPVYTGTVHVHDAVAGSVPPWDFGVVIQANTTLASLPNNGRTLPARTILSWAIPPPNCAWAPIWGNQADFRIRLDP